MFKRLLILSFVTSTAFAQTSATLTNTNTVETNFGQNKIIKAITPDRISHFNIINGPGLSGDAGQAFDETGVQGTSGLSSWHQVSFQYQVSEDTRFVINPRFVMSYNDPDMNDANPGGNLDNPVLGIQSTWYKNGKFTFAGGLNTVFAVVDADDQREQLLANPGGFNAVNYQVNSKLNVGSWLWGRYVYKQAADNEVPIFVAPYLTYAVNDKFTIQPFYQWNGEIERTDKTTFDIDDNFNVLFSYRINRALNIQPIITLYRATDFNIAQGNLNMWVSGSF